MKRNFRAGLFSIILLVTLVPGVRSVAQMPPPRDTTAMTPRAFDENLLRSFKANKDFQYETVLEPTSSLWDRFWFRVWSIISQMLGSETGGTAFKWGLRIAAVAIIAWFIWQLTKMRASGLFSSNRSARMAYSVEHEDIHAIDFSREINQAISDADYRRAVRLLYLQTLKKLSDSGQISWRIDKTNLSYLAELKQAEFFPVFRRLTAQFENNWYGNIPISKEEYERVSQEFTELNSKLPR